MWNAVGDFLPNLQELRVSEMTGVEALPSTFSSTLTAIGLHESPIADSTIADLV